MSPPCPHGRFHRDTNFFRGLELVESPTEASGDDEGGGSATAAASLPQAVKAVADEISLLHELSNTIRKAGRESANMKAAANFCIKDSEGNDLEPALKHHFSVNIKDRFPGCSDVLLERLASTMVSRRKRILYRRHRYEKAPIRPVDPVPRPELEDHSIPQGVPVEIPEEALQGTDHKAGQGLAETTGTIAKTVTKSATTLAADKYHQASSPSVISGAKTIALGTHEGLIFPRAPRSHIRERFLRLKKVLLDRLKQDAGASYLDLVSEQARNNPSSAEDRWGIIRHRTAQNALGKDLQAMKKKAVEQLRKECYDADAEVVCPYCLYTMSSLDVRDGVRWR